MSKMPLIPSIQPLALLRTACLCACVVLLASCETTRPNRAGGLAGENAESLLAQAERARSDQRATALRIRAAQNFLERQEVQQADEVLGLILPNELSQENRDDYYRTYAQLLLALQDPQGARQVFSFISEATAADQLLLARICRAAELHQCTADALIVASLQLGLDSELLPADIHDQIWHQLNRARQSPPAFTHRYHHAWWLLQNQLREAGSITAQISAWKSWQRQYPSHPASIRPPQRLLQLAAYQPPAIGVLLPLTGDYATAGRAAQHGFMAAYLSEGSDGQANLAQPRVQFFDTANQDLRQLWDAVSNANLDIVVGPLLKSQAEKLAEIAAFDSLPLLTLNYLGTAEQLRPVNLFQLGIAIEDEATSLAHAVHAQGHRSIAVVHSNANWSRRALAGLQQQFPDGLSSAQFSDIKDLTEAVGAAMMVADSEARLQQIARIIGQPVEFLPRARQDLDAIVALTNNVESRALIPALKFHFGDHLPVYATSQAVRPGETASLAKFQVTDMPLFTEDSSTFAELVDAFALSGSSFAELYALGFDAYRLATWLPVIAPDSQFAIPGASGYLWLDADGVFRRELSLQTLP